MKYLTDNEIAVNSMQDAEILLEILVKNGYATTVSREEQLYIVNFEYAGKYCDRNEVVFMRRDEMEEQIFNYDDDIPKLLPGERIDIDWQPKSKML